MAELPNMTPEQFLAAAQRVAADLPDVELVKNQVGNLTIMAGDDYLGFVDLRYGTVELFDDEGPAR